MKAGWKSSEFWVMIVTALAPMAGLPVEPMAAIAAGLYAIARTVYKVWFAKNNPST